MKRAGRAVALVLGFLGVAIALQHGPGGANGAARPVPVILDTDLATDADDAGAVALLHALADQGEAKILAIGVSVAKDHSALVLDAINTFSGARTSPSVPQRQAMPTGPRTRGPAMASNSRRNPPQPSALAERR